MIVTCMVLLDGVQEGGRGSGLLSSWNIGSCDQSSEADLLVKLFNAHEVVVSVGVETSR